jgi:hypothetical protein
MALTLLLPMAESGFRDESAQYSTEKGELSARRGRKTITREALFEGRVIAELPEVNHLFSAARS